MSAFDSAIGRLVARYLVATEERPGAPRGFTVDPSTNWFTWVPPQKKNFTHYRLRIDHDDGEPDIELSAGNFGIQLTRGSRFWLSTFNAFNGLESSKVLLEFGTSTPGGEEITVTASYTATSSPYPIPCIPTPQSGVRLLVHYLQDGTGGRVPNWASCYKNAPTTEIDGTANTLSVIGFTEKSGSWYFDGSFATGLLTP